MQKCTLTSRQRLERKRRGSSASGGRNKGRIDNLIVIGTSRGGHRALAEIFKDLSFDMPAGIVIVLHLPKESLPVFKETLGRYCRLPIKEVVDQERLQQGLIFVPPPGQSAEFTNGMIRVKHDIPKMRVSTINHMFQSAARHYGERVIGVILTGLLRDGTEGLKAVHKAGGVTMVQDPKEAEYRDMPASAMKGLPVTFCLKLAEIGPALELLVRRSGQFETGLAVAVRMLRERVALLLRMSAQSQRNPETQAFLKNELASLRRDLQAIENLVVEAISIPTLSLSTRQVRRSDPLNRRVIPRIKTVDIAERDILMARTKEVVELSEELVRQSKVSIKELKDARRSSRKLMKNFRKGPT